MSTQNSKKRICDREERPYPGLKKPANVNAVFSYSTAQALLSAKT